MEVCLPSMHKALGLITTTFHNVNSYIFQEDKETDVFKRKLNKYVYLFIYLLVYYN